MAITKLGTQPLKYSICVSGAAAGPTIAASAQLAERVGAAIAKEGHVITTGATVGLSYYAALGAKKAGGMSIGFSPASSLREHLRKYRSPYVGFDFINFTGMQYVGRDLYLIQSSDAVITVGGRFGSLHEFTSALEDHKPCGVLLGSGGTADLIPELMQPERLVKRLTAILDIKYKDIKDQLKEQDAEWYLHPSTSSHRAG